MAPTSIQNGANLAQGVGKGYPKINNNIKLEKRKRKHTNDKTVFCCVRRFSQKTEGSMAGRLSMFYEKNKRKKKINMLYKTEHKETQQKQNISQSPSKRWPFKSHDVPTAQGLIWFREKKGCTKEETPDSEIITFLRHLIEFGCHFGAHRISKRVPKSTIFEKHLNKN